MNIRLVKFNEKFLNLSWTWLNDQEIRFLVGAKDFSKEQQKAWFVNLQNRSDYLIWGIQVDRIPIGAAGLKKITEFDCCFWCYIGSKEYWGKGIGTRVLLVLENHARSLGKRSIWLQVLKENTRAISLYRKQRYIPEGETDSLFIMRKVL